MTDPAALHPELSGKPAALLPAGGKNERPLFAVLAILAFLATIALFSVTAAFMGAKALSHQLQAEVTVQVMGASAATRGEVSKRAANVMTGSNQFTKVHIPSKQETDAYLQTWLGDMDLPDDIPLPVMIYGEKRGDVDFDKQALTRQLQAAELDVIIQDRNVWLNAAKRSINLMRLLSLIMLTLVSAAVFGASVFATRAAMAGRRQLMEVLHQIGTLPRTTARIFSARFALQGAKAGIVGGLGGLLLLAALIVTSKGLSSVFTGHWFGSLQLSHVLTAALIPLFMAIVCGVTAWRTVLRTLYREIYP